MCQGKGDGANWSVSSAGLPSIFDRDRDREPRPEARQKNSGLQMGSSSASRMGNGKW
jgi:hypothetical protein